MIFLHFLKCFPASAGVNLWNPAGRIYDHRFPRQCGDQPPLHLHDGDLLPFSPPVRGSTLKFKTFIRVHLVFPAGAGVNLDQDCNIYLPFYFPR